MKRLVRWTAAAAVTCTALLVAAWGAWKFSGSRSHQLFGRLLTRVITTDSVVALTFDDGPAGAFTPDILALLADSGVHATFFAIGRNLEEHPDLARRIVAEGHELANHSWSHQRMVLKSPGFVRREVARTDSLIRAAGQRGAIAFRPPFGKRLVVLPWVLSRTGHTTVLWDLEPDSYQGINADPDRIVSFVRDNVRPGSIILLHVETTSRRVNRAALPGLIGVLHAAGYRFVTVADLVERSAGG